MQDVVDDALRAYGVATAKRKDTENTEILDRLRRCDEAISFIENQMTMISRAYELGQTSRNILELVRSGVLEPSQILHAVCRDVAGLLAAANLADDEFDPGALSTCSLELEAFVSKIVDIGDKIIETRTENVRLEREFTRALEDVRRKHLGVTFSRTGKLRGTVHANRGAMYLLFREILSNAFKYRSDDRDLIIATSETQDREELAVSISDNGIGIPEEFCKTKIFQPGVRLDGAKELDHKRRENLHGQGLGLSIAKSIAVYLSGSISAKSSVGVGTEFIIRLKAV